MKKLFLILLLIPIFCTAQSPYQDLLIPTVDTGNTFLDNFNVDVDTIVYPDTSLVIGMWGITDTGYWHEVPCTLNIIERSEDTISMIDLEPIVTNISKDILNQNKLDMKIFEYVSVIYLATDNDRRQINEITNAYGTRGWEAYAIDFTKRIIFFKREIQQ